MNEFQYARRVQFHETDAAGILHYAKMLCLVEEAEHACLQQLGIPVLDHDGGWPRVRVEVDYRSPLRLHDEAEVRLSVVSLGRSSITWGFQIVKSSGGDEVQLVAEGRQVTVYVDREGHKKALTDSWRELLG